MDYRDYNTRCDWPCTVLYNAMVQRREGLTLTEEITGVPLLGLGLEPLLRVGVAGDMGDLGTLSAFVGVRALCSPSIFVGVWALSGASVLGGLFTSSLSSFFMLEGLSSGPIMEAGRGEERREGNKQR